ncbi:MAG: hypothetical protein ACRCTJ_00165, partial [Brevinema sp.]
LNGALYIASFTEPISSTEKAVINNELYVQVSKDRDNNFSATNTIIYNEKYTISFYNNDRFISNDTRTYRYLVRMD